MQDARSLQWGIYLDIYIEITIFFKDHFLFVLLFLSSSNIVTFKKILLLCHYKDKQFKCSMIILCVINVTLISNTVTENITRGKEGEIDDNCTKIFCQCGTSN